MTKIVKFLAVVLIGAGLMAGAPAFAKSQINATPVAARGGTPSDVVNRFYGQLVTVMKQGDQLGFSGRYRKLESPIKNAFDLPLMTRFATGLGWSKATPEEQQQLVSAFSDFSVANYASQFKNWDGETFQVVDEKPSDEGVIVETKLKPKEGDAVTLNYLMRKDDKGNWRIVDVFLDGAISQLATRRAEFTSIVRRDGIDALVNSLDNKAKQMGPS